MTQTYHPNDAVSSPRYVPSTPDWVKPLIDKAAAAKNIPTIVLSALLKQESGFNPTATSSAGAVGIAQFLPSTAQGRGVDPMNPASAIMGAAQYLREGMDKYGSLDKALAAYNAGFGNVDHYQGIPPFKETQNYVKNIMGMISDPHASFYGPVVDYVNDAKKEKEKNTGFNSSGLPTSLNTSGQNGPQQQTPAGVDPNLFTNMQNTLAQRTQTPKQPPLVSPVPQPMSLVSPLPPSDDLAMSQNVPANSYSGGRTALTDMGVTPIGRADNAPQ